MIMTRSIAGMELLVNRVQRYCLHDGPGIRTAVFLQGCPLRCWWCHNPEARSEQSREMRTYEIPELVSVLERDARYWIRSGGGVTVSGGEPLYQPVALQELLIALGSHNYHRAVETSGVGTPADLQRIAPHVDLWLWDLKAVTPEIYRKGTGGDVSVTLANLSWLLQNAEAPVIARIPLIPDFNLNEQELTRIADRLKEEPRASGVELLPGHSCGWVKAKTAQPPGRISVDSSQLQWARELLEKKGIKVTRKPTGGLA